MLPRFSAALLLLRALDAPRWVASQATLSFGESSLGVIDLSVTAGNPMKGLAANPDFFNYDPSVVSIDSSLDVYYIPLSDVMVADPDVVGFEQAFDWESVERRLNGSASFSRHAVLSFAVHYPSEPLYVPQYLLDANITLQYYPSGSGLLEGYSPDYGEEILLRALEQFVSELGRKYDGDSRIAVIHLGLLGFWGEWHTFPLTGLVPDYAKERITTAYSNAFSFTKLQGRYPYGPTYDAGFGLYDASFGFNTLDGEPNGGIEHHWYFWPYVTSSNQGDFWRRAFMGSETRPEIQNTVFGLDYPAGTYERQDFTLCVETTHNTYTFHQDAWVEGGYTGEMLDNALLSHGMMGYSFAVLGVVVSFNGPVADVSVDVQQVGVAPFYYPLDLTLTCAGMPSRSLPGVELLVDKGEHQVFQFGGVPNNPSCLSQLTFSLSSPLIYESRPIKFAQGDGTVKVVVPTTNSPTQLPTTNSPTQLPTTTSPTQLPTTNSPTNNPTTSSPTELPTDSPTHGPTAKPSAAPTSTPTAVPTSLPPTNGPTNAEPTEEPTSSPTTSAPVAATGPPTESPTTKPSGAPSGAPTDYLTFAPTPKPTKSPITPAPTETQHSTLSPTPKPTSAPTKAATPLPTEYPTLAPTRKITAEPSKAPTTATDEPTQVHSMTLAPVTVPTDEFSFAPARLDVQLVLVHIDGSESTILQDGGKYPSYHNRLSVMAQPNFDNSLIDFVEFKYRRVIKYEGQAPYTLAGDEGGVPHPALYLNRPAEKYISVFVYSDGKIVASRSVRFQMVSRITGSRHLRAKNSLSPNFFPTTKSLPNQANVHAESRVYEQTNTTGLPTEFIHASNTPWGPSMMQIVFAETTGKLPARFHS